jgi:hypothetical protein
MDNQLSTAIGLGLILGAIHGAVQPSQASVTPSFTTGTVTSRTESTQTVTESIIQTDLQTGFTYTVSGTNINLPPNPGVDAVYTQVVPGAATQFSETFFGPGISRVTEIERTTTTTSVTDSLSVFTQ